MCAAQAGKEYQNDKANLADSANITIIDYEDHYNPRSLMHLSSSTGQGIRRRETLLEPLCCTRIPL
jgi:hypothetical protein